MGYSLDCALETIDTEMPLIYLRIGFMFITSIAMLTIFLCVYVFPKIKAKGGMRWNYILCTSLLYFFTF